MNWTPNRKAKQVVSNYDHTMLMTPIGEFIIEWKSWKTEPDYDITFRDTEWIGNENSLDAAKEKVRQYLNGKRDELVVFLSGGG